MDEGVDNLSRLDGVRVLVVDDSAVIRDLLAATLEERGAVVTAVGTAEAALGIIVQERPDVLVSDLEMPDKGGYWLIGQVRTLSPEQGGTTPAAAITGLTGPRSEEHTSELQSLAYLVCRLLLEKKKQKQIRQLQVTVRDLY